MRSKWCLIIIILASLTLFPIHDIDAQMYDTGTETDESLNETDTQSDESSEEGDEEEDDKEKKKKETEPEVKDELDKDLEELRRHADAINSVDEYEGEEETPPAPQPKPEPQPDAPAAPQPEPQPDPSPDITDAKREEAARKQSESRTQPDAPAVPEQTPPEEPAAPQPEAQPETEYKPITNPVTDEDRARINKEWNEKFGTPTPDASSSAQTPPEEPAQISSTTSEPTTPSWGKTYAPLGEPLSREESVSKINNYFRGTPLEGENIGERWVRAAEDVAASTDTYVDPLLSFSIAAHETGDWAHISAKNNLGGNKILSQGWGWTKSLPEDIRSGLDYSGNSTEYQGFESIDGYAKYQNYFLSQYPGLQSSVKNNRLPSGYAEDSAWGNGVRNAYKNIINGKRTSKVNIPRNSTSRKQGLTY